MDTLSQHNSLLMKTIFIRIKTWLQGLSFRTGVIVLAMCIPFYIIAFAQMAIPTEYLTIETKGILLFIFFGMAKTCQYGGLTIVGVEGYKRVKNWFTRR